MKLGIFISLFITIFCFEEDLEYQNQVSIVLYEDQGIPIYRNGGNISAPKFTFNKNYTVGTGDCIYNHVGRKLSCNTLPLIENTYFQESRRWYHVIKGEQFAWPPFYVGYETKPYNINVTMVTISVRPAVFSIQGLMTESECDEFKRDALEREMFTSQIYGTDGNTDGHSAGRSSEQVWTDPDPKKQFATDVRNKIKTLTKISQDDLYESFQVARYKPNGHYYAHYDWFDSVNFRESREDIARGHNRYLTLITYASTPAKGGQTNFPVSEMGVCRNEWPNDIWSSCMEGILIEPVKANTIMFYSMYPKHNWKGDPDLRSLHAGCDLEDGEKWIINQWIHNINKEQAMSQPRREEVIEAYKWTKYQNSSTKSNYWIHVDGRRSEYLPKKWYRPYGRSC